MSISRRRFLELAAGLSTAGLAGPSRRAHRLGCIPKALPGCTLVDAGLRCTLGECVAGYEAALISSQVACERASLKSPPAARLVILPAAVFADGSSVARVRALLENGAKVLLECGAAFLNAEEFVLQRRLMKSAFGLSLHDPVRLWEPSGSFKQLPYVDYQWPVITKIRDFSRVIPVGCRNGEIIGWCQHLPVAARCRVESGTLAFLGSPLGPHLWAGDREARNWFKALCCCC